MLLKDRPEFKKQWDFKKNEEIGLDYETITCGSNKKAWWICEKGHSYFGSICGHVNRHERCPYCAGQKVLKGFNDLATTHPEIAKEWYTRRNVNKGYTPDSVISGGKIKFWWKCSKGHIYRATIADRKNGYGCPYCGHQKSVGGRTDLYSRKPELMKEWDFKKNDELGLNPKKLLVNSNKEAWWICPKGHSYLKRICLRTNNKEGCPYCAGRKIEVGNNDLASVKPELAKQWNYEKNKDSGLTPYNVTISSSKKVWWRCEKGHEWEAQIAQRSLGRGCPYCSNRIIAPGINDLATTHPDLMKEWDYENNNKIGLDPTKLSQNKKVSAYWICPNGHSYKRLIDARALQGKGCPICEKANKNGNK